MSNLQNTFRQPARQETKCAVCHRPVSLENSKTDERGMAVHEECYIAKVSPDSASHPAQK